MSLTLSIIIPTKDRPGFLPASVAAALRALPAQGGEVIVVDDRSKQPADELLSEITDSRLRVFVNQRAPGPAGARNFGVDKAEGRIILFLDDDDLVLPGYPQWIIDGPAAANGADYGFSTTRPLATVPRKQEAFVPPAQAKSVASRPFRRQLAAFSWGFWVRRDLFLSVGGIAEDIRVNEDTDFSLRLLEASARGVWSDKPGVLVRMHTGPANLPNITRRTGAAERAHFFGLILARHAAFLKDNPEACRHLMKRRLKFLAKVGDHTSARATLAPPIAPGLRRRLQVFYWINHLVYRFKKS